MLFLQILPPSPLHPCLSVISGVTLANWWYYISARFFCRIPTPREGESWNSGFDVQIRSGKFKNASRLPAVVCVAFDLPWHCNSSSFFEPCKVRMDFESAAAIIPIPAGSCTRYPLPRSFYLRLFFVLLWWPMLISYCPIGSVMSRTLLGYSIPPDKRITIALDL